MQPHSREKELDNLNVQLIRTLEKMRDEREDIFEKNATQVRTRLAKEDCEATEAALPAAD